MINGVQFCKKVSDGNLECIVNSNFHPFEREDLLSHIF